MTLNVNFTTKELNQLVNNEDTGVKLVQKYDKCLILPPVLLSSPKRSIKDHLNSSVAKYDQKLDGIILSYKWVKVEPSFSVLDNGRIKIRCVADIYVFKPRVDCVLTGIINKKSKEHLGCLVHKVFNIVIPRPKDSTDWQEKVQMRLKIGDEVRFKVVEVDLNDVEMPYIKGELIDLSDGTLENEESLVSPKKKKKKRDKEKNDPDKDSNIETHEDEVSPRRNKSESRDEDTLDGSYKKVVEDSSRYEDGTETENMESSVKEKKKKKRKRSRSYNEGSVDKDSNIETHDDEVSPRKKRKKSKTHDEDTLDGSYKKVVEDSSRYEDGTETENMESSVKEKKKKKRKRSRSYNEGSVEEISVDKDSNIETYKDEASPRKKRKKSKTHDNTSDENYKKVVEDGMHEDGIETENMESSIKKKKKSKRSRSFDGESVGTIHKKKKKDDETENTYEKSPKKNRRSKSIDHGTLDVEVEIKEKKKNKKPKGHDKSNTDEDWTEFNNTNERISGNEVTNSIDYQENKIKKKKKKSRNYDD